MLTPFYLVARTVLRSVQVATSLNIQVLIQGSCVCCLSIILARVSGRVLEWSESSKYISNVGLRFPLKRLTFKGNLHWICRPQGKGNGWPSMCPCQCPCAHLERTKKEGGAKSRRLEVIWRWDIRILKNNAKLGWRPLPFSVPP